MSQSWLQGFTFFFYRVPKFNSSEGKHPLAIVVGVGEVSLFHENKLTSITSILFHENSIKLVVTS